MTDRLTIQTQQDDELKKELAKVNWGIEFGHVKIQIRNGKPVTLAVEHTSKWD